jgi:fluoroquinolone resistance protein
MPLTDAEEFYEEIFVGEDWSKGTLSMRTFEACHFQRCDFSDATVSECKFLDCHFVECNLSLLKVPGSKFRSAGFEECKALGIDWTRASWQRFVSAAQLKFYRCNLSDSSFFGVALQECVFDNCKARDVDFREANLTGARLTFTDLSRALFGKTILSRADFSDATSFDIDVFDNPIVGARFSRFEALRLLASLEIVLVD